MARSKCKRQRGKNKPKDWKVNSNKSDVVCKNRAEDIKADKTVKKCGYCKC